MWEHEQTKLPGWPDSQVRELRGQKVALRPLRRSALEEVALWPKYTGLYACYNRKNFETRDDRDEWYARNVEVDAYFWLSIHKLNGDFIGIISICRLKDDPWQREAEIGIEIRSDECGKG